MKRTLRILTAALFLTAALCVNASAADFEPVAQELSTIGMFKGTGASFELDRAPTRAEAAIMLVRLYGAEEEAGKDYADGAITHPFTDVPDFAAPHVAWLYSEGLTKGMSADKFGSTEACSAQNYATFLLRALGYTDGKDFEYADALDFAAEKGFYSSLMFAGDFLRDDLAAMTYQALAADTAEGKTFLLDQLIKDGAVDETAALPMLSKMETYRELQTVYNADSDALDMEFLMSMDMTMTAGGETMTSNVYASGAIQTIVDGKDVEMAYLMTTISDGAMMDMGIWLKDGWVYQYASDGALTQTIKYAATDEMALYEELGVEEMTAVNVSDLAALKSITKEKDGSNTVYTMVTRDGLGGIMDSMMDLMGQSSEENSMGMTVGESTVYYILDRKGQLKEMGMMAPYSISMALPDETGASVTTNVSCTMRMTMTVNATGKSVKIDYPDLDGFVEVTMDDTSAS